MNPMGTENDPLEPLIDRTLRSLPPLRAPQSLETRVLAEIERRAALPWWKQSFLRWPLPVRALFVLASLGATKGAVDASMWLMDRLRGLPIPGAITEPAASLESVATVTSSLTSAVTALFQGIPVHWLYAAGITAAAMYAALVGLGAIAYRTLYK
jgi:hypothetical protein